MKLNILWPLCMAAVLSACSATAGPGVAFDPVLENLRAGHPRLLFTKADQERVEALARTDQDLQLIIANLLREADRALEEPVAIYTVQEPRPRLLQQSRAALSRISRLSLAYRLTGDEAYLRRAVLEMETAAAFPDWNPRHFLDVGEMTTAFAIGYDWLYDALSPDERRMIRQAIVEKGLEPGLEIYARNPGWMEVRPSNWNQVCNGGLIMGALAIADEEPTLAAAILKQAKGSVPHGMAPFMEDGAYPEGPMYWWYGTMFNVILIDALQTALGTDWGLTEIEGFKHTAGFRIHATSPNNLLFNYGDSNDRANLAPALFWFARQYDRMDWADVHRRRLVQAIHQDEQELFSRLMALDVVWYVPQQESEGHERSLDALFRSKGDVAMMRSAWDDPSALHVAFQGIWNQAPHAQLDHGSFVLDADGVRWAVDLGSERYSLPDFWDYSEGGVRWTYYKCSNLSHNTLTIGGQLQRADAVAPVISFHSDSDYAHAVMDLSQTYEGQVEEAFRGIAMLQRSRVLVQDEVKLRDDTSSVRWAMVTEADVRLEGSTAVLTQDGRMLRAEILSPAGAHFELLSTNSGDDRQSDNAGTLMLATTVRPGAARFTTISVLLTPVGPAWPASPAPQIGPLAQWQRH